MRFERLLLDALEELHAARAAQALFAGVIASLCAGAPAPRDVPLERTVIAHVLIGSLLSSAIDRLYDWHPLHAPLVARLRELISPHDALQSGELLVRPLCLTRALRGTVERLSTEDSPMAAVLRLETLQRQRRALAAALRAMRELRSLGGNQDAARAHLLDAIRALEEAS